KPPNILIFPIQDYPAYSFGHILQFLRQNHSLSSPIVFISFSAGVVGAIAAAWGWQLLGGKVTAFIALDGWGVPLTGSFPIHRLSHDYFTHWSSALLGSGEDSFYAAPSVEHLELWRQPQTISGWWVHPQNKEFEQKMTSAAQFLAMLLERYNVWEF
ncbi:MAG TPA: hypothetical protein VIQ31_32530, partial [Phormidium sp.]